MITLAAALAARAAAFEAEVAAALQGLRREREDRWEAVRARVETLTRETTLAARAQRREAPASRAQVAATLRSVDELDRVRRQTEDEIWGQLRAARGGDARCHAQLARQAHGLAALGARLLGETGRAFAEATAPTARVAESPAGRALARQLGAARQELAGRLAALDTQVGAGLARLGARGLADGGEVARRFEGAMAARVGGAGLATARPRPQAAARKKARVPGFLLGKFYRPGGLRADGGGVELTFVNPLGFCIVQGGDPVAVDGRPFPAEETTLDNGERSVRGDELSGAQYLKFPRGGAIRVTLRGLALPPGPHRFLCSLELRKMGWVALDVADRLS